ncbi:MAG: hypothetical protein WD749_08610 [Phycisphaerales bacterium]
MTFRNQRRLHPLLVLFLAAVITAIPAAILAACLNLALWGYWIDRPSLDRRVLSAASLVTVTPVWPERQPDGSLELLPVAGPLGTPGWESGAYQGPGWYAQSHYPNEDDYYLLDFRALRTLEQTGKATRPLPALGPEQTKGLMALVRNAGVIVKEDPGYNQWQTGAFFYSGGLIYELLGEDGESLLLIALRGGEVSNDHRTYYELLFRRGPAGQPTLLSAHQFYFDVAGVEGMEFRPIFLTLLTLGLLVVMPTTLLVLAFRWMTHRARREAGQCPSCAYNLTGLAPGTPCPECGLGTPRPTVPAA